MAPNTPALSISESHVCKHCEGALRLMRQPGGDLNWECVKCGHAIMLATITYAAKQIAPMLVRRKAVA